jgi:hypothetical protein
MKGKNITKDKTYKSLRAVQYCEVWLFRKTAQGGTDIVYYNTSDYNNSENKMDTCPAGMWAKVEPAELKAKYDIEYAFKNGPRGWTMDHITLPVGSVVEFEGLKTRWMGQGELLPGVQMKPGGDLQICGVSSEIEHDIREGEAGFHPGRPGWRALGDAGILGHRGQDNHLRFLGRPGREAQDA